MTAPNMVWAWCKRSFIAVTVAPLEGILWQRWHWFLSVSLLLFLSFETLSHWLLLHVALTLLLGLSFTHTFFLFFSKTSLGNQTCNHTETTFFSFCCFEELYFLIKLLTNMEKTIYLCNHMFISSTHYKNMNKYAQVHFFSCTLTFIKYINMYEYSNNSYMSKVVQHSLKIWFCFIWLCFLFAIQKYNLEKTCHQKIKSV